MADQRFIYSKTAALLKTGLYEYKDGRLTAAEQQLSKRSLREIANALELIAAIALDREYTGEESEEEQEREKVLFEFHREEDELYHHTYLDEQRLLDCVREGREEDALRYNREIDDSIGRLSNNELNHWKNMVVVAVTLCTRAAIESGVAAAIAYQISDFYIQKADRCSDIAGLINHRNNAVRELIRQVRDAQVSGACSAYVHNCRRYVNTHYREKIYLEDIARTLGISGFYLSKLFKKETGKKFQDYVIEVRVEHAAGLLRYSQESIRYIGEYVNFPSQSYFGRMFKRFKNMTPAEYRNAHKIESC